MRLAAPSELEALWPQVSVWIGKAIEYGQGDEDLIDVALAIHHGRYDLWIDDKFAAVVQTVRHPKQTVLTVLYIGGELDAIVPFFEFAKKWCKDHNVHVLRTYGRHGWKKVVPLRQVGVILQVNI